MKKSLFQPAQQLCKCALRKTQEYINQIHNILEQFKQAKDSCQIITDMQHSLIYGLPQDSVIKSLLEKSILCHQYLFDIIVKQKQLISSSQTLIQQIQLFEVSVKNQKQNQQKDQKFRSVLNELKNNLQNLPISKLKFQFEKNKNQSQIKINKYQSQQISKLKQENNKLQTKITKYEQRITSIQSKLVQILQTSQQEQIKDMRQNKMIDRICKSVFSEQFMIQANFDIRNQHYGLIKENKQLHIQLNNVLQAKQKQRQNFESQKKRLLNIIDRVDNSTRISQISGIQPKNSNNWIYAIQKLQDQIESLKWQRKHDQKLIKDLEHKVSYLEESRSMTSLADKVTQFKKKKYSPSIVQTTKNFYGYDRQANKRKNSRHLQVQDVGSFQGKSSSKNLEISQNNKKSKNQPIIKYSKSTCTLKQKRIQPQFNAVKYRPSKFQYQPYSSEIIEDPQKSQQLKTSGFFKDPENNSSYNYNVNYKNNHKFKSYNQLRNIQGRTFSNLA